MNSVRTIRFAARPALRKLTTSVVTTAPTINIASTAPSATMLEQTGTLMNRCITQNLQLLDMVTDADFKKRHNGKIICSAKSTMDLTIFRFRH